MDLAVVGAETVSARGWSGRPSCPRWATRCSRWRRYRVTFGSCPRLGRSFRGPRGRRITGSIEHTAPVGPRFLGGPLLDAEGRLVGLTSVRLDGGLALAVAADSSLRERAQSLAAGESPSRRSLGWACCRRA